MMDEWDSAHTELAQCVSRLAQLTVDVQKLMTLVGFLNEDRDTAATEGDDSRANVRTFMEERDSAWTELQTLRQQTEAFAEATRDRYRIIARLRRDMRVKNRRNGA